jgi:hypothetical protein
VTPLVVFGQHNPGDQAIFKAQMNGTVIQVEYSELNGVSVVASPDQLAVIKLMLKHITTQDA